MNKENSKSNLKTATYLSSLISQKLIKEGSAMISCDLVSHANKLSKKISNLEKKPKEK